MFLSKNVWKTCTCGILIQNANHLWSRAGNKIFKYTSTGKRVIFNQTP